MTKPTKWHVRPAKTQLSLDIAQSDQSALCAEWVSKDLSFLHADREDSDQTTTEVPADGQRKRQVYQHLAAYPLALSSVVVGRMIKEMLSN